jgi:hypothetical protein
MYSLGNFKVGAKTMQTMKDSANPETSKTNTNVKKMAEMVQNDF